MTRSDASSVGTASTSPSASAGKLASVGATSEQKQRDALERRMRVVELYTQGMSVRAVAAVVGCHPQTARADLRDSGVPVRGTNKPQTAARICARDGCENSFRPSPRQLRNGFGKYCSRACDHEAHRIHPKPDPRVCARDGCENTFTPTGSNVAMGWGTYCSQRCSALSTDAHRRKKGETIACQELRPRDLAVRRSAPPRARRRLLAGVLGQVPVEEGHRDLAGRCEPRAGEGTAGLARPVEWPAGGPYAGRPFANRCTTRRSGQARGSGVGQARDRISAAR